MAWQPDYVTVPELKDYYRIDASDTVDDVAMGHAIAAASRAVDHHCGRQFGQVDSAQERTYTAEYDAVGRYWFVEVDDVQDLTGLSVTVDGQAVTDWTAEPVNAAADGKPYTTLRLNSGGSSTVHGVKITGLWGWSAVPDVVVQATTLQASRLSWRRGAPAGVAGSPETGSEVRLLAKLDPDVAVVLSSVIRWWAVA